MTIDHFQEPPVSLGVNDRLNMLSPGQLAHMHTFGFLLLRGLLTADEAHQIEREASDIMAAEGVAHPGGQALQPFFERGHFLSQLLADDRIYTLGEDLLGADFFLDGTEGNIHSGQTPWHGGNGRQTRLLPEIKIAFYPQPLTLESGCLRVIPGTHRVTDPDPFAVLRDRGDDPDFRPFGMRPDEVPCTPLETEPGDVVVFHEDLLRLIRWLRDTPSARRELRRLSAHGRTARPVARVLRATPLRFPPGRILHQQRESPIAAHGCAAGRTGIRDIEGLTRVKYHYHLHQLTKAVPEVPIPFVDWRYIQPGQISWIKGTDSESALPQHSVYRPVKWIAPIDPYNSCP